MVVVATANLEVDVPKARLRRANQQFVSPSAFLDACTRRLKETGYELVVVFDAVDDDQEHQVGSKGPPPTPPQA